MTEQTIARHALFRGGCKCLSVVLATTILIVGAMGRIEFINILWAAAPLICLWLLDTGYTAADIHVSVSSSADKAGTDDSILRTNPSARFLQALGAPSVWPFYVILLALVFGGAKALPKPIAGYPSQFPGVTGPATYRQSTTNPAVLKNPVRPIQPPANAPGAATRLATPPFGRPAGVQPTVHQSPSAPPPAASPAPQLPSSPPPAPRE